MRNQILIFTAIAFSLEITGCSKDHSCEGCMLIETGLPEVQTIDVGDITHNSATFQGSLIKTGGSTISDFGFCWAMNDSPTLLDFKISNGQANNLQNFSNQETRLTPNQTYYVRAFATNNQGTIYGKVLGFKTATSCKDTSLYFDGIHINNTGDFNNDHVDIGTNGPMSVIDANTSYTIEVWAKHGLASYPGGWERIYSKDNIFQFRVVDNKLTGELGNSAIQTPYPLDTFWHHIAFVREKSSNTLKLFIDGQLKITAPDNSGAVSNNGKMECIGARNNGIGIYELWTGNLKYLRVSNMARYSSSFLPAKRYSSDINTLVLWPFNEGAGDVLGDISGNGRNGMVTNAIWEIGSCQ